MCCFNKVNLSAILLVHKRIINKDCTVKNNNEVLKCILVQKVGCLKYKSGLLNGYKMKNLNRHLHRCENLMSRDRFVIFVILVVSCSKLMVITTKYDAILKGPVFCLLPDVVYSNKGEMLAVRLLNATWL